MKESNDEMIVDFEVSIKHKPAVFEDESLELRPGLPFTMAILALIENPGRALFVHQVGFNPYLPL